MWGLPGWLVSMPLVLGVSSAVAALLGLWRVSGLAAAGALVWPGVQLAGSTPTMYAVGLVVGPLWPSTVGCLGLTLIGARLRVPVALGIICAAAGWARALVYEPFADPACHRACVRGPFVSEVDLGTGRVLLVAASVAGLAMGAVLVAAGVRALTTRPLMAAGVVTTGIALMVEQAGTAVTSAPAESLPSPLVAVHMAAAMCTAGLVTVAAVERALLFRRMSGVRHRLIAGTGNPGELLAAAVRDEGLSVGHYVEDVGYVGSDGAVIGAADTARQRTEVRGPTGSIAMIDHSRSVPVYVIRKRLGPTIATAIQIEGLRLRLEAHVAAIADSRRRIVERGDVERARLERDLHDGAQQGVLELMINLRRLRERAERLGDTAVAQHAAVAQDAARDVLSGLRAIARGIHPPILAAAGLLPALQDLADTAPDPFLLDVDGLGRLPVSIERTVYAIARDATVDGVTAMQVRGGGEIVIRVRTDEPPRQAVLDRVAAASGNLHAVADGWEARVPCG